MNKRLWILVAVLLIAFGTALAGDAPVTETVVPNDEAEASACESTPIDFAEMSAEQLQLYADEHDVIVTATGGGGLPDCGAEARRCANAKGGCAPTSSCSYADTGLETCQSDGATISCKYGQTVHIRTCECNGVMVPCYGTDLRLVCN